jgi:glycosyltransferase involved in cell wall biosynthesis
MTSTSYPENSQDWRGRFIANLAAGLGRRNDLALALWAPPGDLPPAVTDATPADTKSWLREMSHRGGIAHLMRKHPLLALVTIVGLLGRLRSVYRDHPTDLAHVNWLQNALPLWGTTTPAVISVLGTDFGLLRLPGMTYLLRSIFKQRRTILAPNAEWMALELERAFGDIAEIQPVAFGVDNAWFDLQRRPPKDKIRHWLVITRLTKNKIGDLFEWGEGRFDKNRILHLFGPMQEQVVLPDWVQYHGPTNAAELLTNWFPHASGMITLSCHDEGRPQVMLEAMAAGLPIIASDLPAHRDFLQHKQTGWLAKSREDFSQALTYMEQAEHNHVIGAAAQLWARQNIGTWDDCAARYAALYAKLLKATP